MTIRRAFTPLVALLGACTDEPRQPAVEPPETQNQAQATSTVSPSSTPGEATPAQRSHDQAQIEAPALGSPGGLPNDREPFSEGDVKDPKSPAAAGLVAERYLGALEAGDLAKAKAMEPSGAAELRKEAEQAKLFRAQIGGPFGLEGAAGSIYLNVPVVTYGRDSSGRPFNHRWTLVIRRANDMPGATARQLAWHLHDAHRAGPGEWPKAR